MRYFIELNKNNNFEYYSDISSGISGSGLAFMESRKGAYSLDRMKGNENIARFSQKCAKSFMNKNRFNDFVITFFQHLYGNRKQSFIEDILETNETERLGMLAVMFNEFKYKNMSNNLLALIDNHNSKKPVLLNQVAYTNWIKKELYTPSQMIMYYMLTTTPLEYRQLFNTDLNAKLLNEEDKKFFEETFLGRMFEESKELANILMEYNPLIFQRTYQELNDALSLVPSYVLNEGSEQDFTYALDNDPDKTITILNLNPLQNYYASSYRVVKSSLITAFRDEFIEHMKQTYLSMNENDKKALRKKLDKVSEHLNNREEKEYEREI